MNKLFKKGSYIDVKSVKSIQKYYYIAKDICLKVCFEIWKYVSKEIKIESCRDGSLWSESCVLITKVLTDRIYVFFVAILLTAKNDSTVKKHFIA